jgi:cysteine desulfurase
MQEVIYLDYNATSPMLPGVKEAMFQLAGKPLNPSSIHASGRAARKVVEDARANILQAVNAKSLLFCGSATEANNQLANTGFQGTSFIISAIEHESILKAHPIPEIVPVTSDGIIDLEALEETLAGIDNKNPKLLSVMLANNETGIIQPVKEVVNIAQKFGALVHTDAVQAYGRIAIDFEKLGVDFMTIAPHKSGGAVGSAALIHKPNIELKSFIRGGGQEKNKRAGTENVLAIHAFGTHAKINKPLTNDLNQYLESEVKKISADFVVVGRHETRLPNTTNLVHPKLGASTQLIHFDGSGICLSIGSACSSG